MKRKTPGQVKNLMHRAFSDLLDPPPTASEQQRLREHFEHRCAYCYAPAEPRYGHLDHAVPGRGNGVGNLILACSVCNGDEKREMPWEAFLLLKCRDDEAALEERRHRIHRWIEAEPGRTQLPESLVAAVAAAEAEAKAAFDTSFRRAREAVAAWRSEQGAKE